MPASVMKVTGDASSGLIRLIDGVVPDLTLIEEIEVELGNIFLLERSLSENAWRSGDLVTLTQILLQAAGEVVDYRALTETMLRTGLKHYVQAAQRVLRRVMTGGEVI